MLIMGILYIITIEIPESPIGCQANRRNQEKSAKIHGRPC